MRTGKFDELCQAVAGVLGNEQSCTIVCANQDMADSVAHRVSLKIGKPMEAVLREQSAYFPNSCSSYDLTTKSPSD